MSDIRALGIICLSAGLGTTFGYVPEEYLVGQHVPNNGTTYVCPPEKLGKRAKRRLRGKAKARP